MERIILHYDMDAFYASIEIRDKPHLYGKPVIVGRRVITTCNYEARKYGLHSAMSVSQAKKLCPRGIYLPVDKDKYIAEAEKIQGLISCLSDKVEFIAFDEGFIDISDLSEKYKDLDRFAKKFIERIYKHTGLTCSLGIGYNKLSAKLASEVNKPDNYYIIKDQNEFKNYVYNKDIKILPGVGKKTQEVLRARGINQVSDILSYSLLELQGLFGHIKGQLLYEYALGIDTRKVGMDSRNKSIGNETTYMSSVEDIEYIYRTLDEIFEKISFRLISKKWFAKTVTLKIKYGDRTGFTKSKSLKDYTNSKQELKNCYIDLRDELILERNVILVGLSFSNIVEKREQQLSFDSISNLKKKKVIVELKNKIKEYEDIF